MSDALEVQSLAVAYHGVDAVVDVSLQVPVGTCVGILGANGAGKTTLLRGISGFEKTRAGRVTLGGVPLDRRPASGRARAGLGHVLEGRHIFPDLTVRENLEVASVSTGRRAPAERWDHVMELLPELAPLLARPGGALSGGQQQFLALARAMLAGPSVILLDEPTVGLAPRLVERIVEIVNDLTRRGVGILLVEQNIDVVQRTASRVHLLVHGRSTAELDATTPDLAARARDAYLS
jgi:ABC-type branched-subunit amino acid transport system ATPase component